LDSEVTVSVASVYHLDKNKKNLLFRERDIQKRRAEKYLLTNFADFSKTT